MPLLESSSLNPGVRKREVLGWAMYDFANSGYTTVVLTAVFNVYFIGVVAGNAPWATLAWTVALAVSSLLVMAIMPLLGAYADLVGMKKRLLALTTFGCCACTVGLAYVGPGDVAWAMVAIILSNLFYAIGESLIAAFLPELARPQAIGRVSGWGWSFGYLGGMLALGLGLAWVMAAQGRGETASQFVPVTIWLTAGLYALASLATFAWLQERVQPANALVAPGPRAALGRLLHTWHEARSYQDFAWLLACAVAYQAGISVVIALAAVYAEQVLGFKQIDTMMLVFLVNIAAAIGAFSFGYFQDRTGHKRALGWTLIGWIVMTGLAVAATTPALFWLAAVLAGLCMGSSQSAGRAMAGLLAPAGRAAEFYGLWTFATRLSAVLGPITYGLVTWITLGNHRLAILSTGLFFVVGWALLHKVDMNRGRAAARRSHGDGTTAGAVK